MKNWYLFVALCWMWTACHSSPNDSRHPRRESQLTNYQNYSPSIALLENKFYYKVSLSGGEQFYATSTPSGELILHFEEEQAKFNAKSVYGTAFFISKEGHCATNRHVIYPEENIEGFEEKMIASLYSHDLQIPGNSIDIQLLSAEGTSAFETLEWGSPSQFSYPALPGVEKIERIYFDLSLILNDHCVHLKKKKISCRIVKIADDPEIDLAVLKINTEELEGNPIFPIAIEDGEIDFMSNDSPIYLLGLQVSLGRNNDISCLSPEVQKGSHYLSTHPKVARYKIDASPGSSGSPVVNERGELLAINFAKTASLEGWSLGIPRIYISDLLKEALMEEQQRQNQSQ
jgi:hypothetical protein